MLGNHASSAIVAVSDLARARDFYVGTLGLEVLDEAEAMLTLKTGATRLHVYPSTEAGHNRGNAVVWGVGPDLDAIVADLEAKGVTFELYPEMTDVVIEGNVHRYGDNKLVWLKDPDGNILHFNDL